MVLMSLSGSSSSSSSSSTIICHVTHSCCEFCLYTILEEYATYAGKTETRTSEREVTVGEFIHINTLQQKAMQYHISILACLIQHLANNTNNAGTNPDLTIKFLTKKVNGVVFCCLCCRVSYSMKPHVRNIAISCSKLLILISAHYQSVQRTI